MPSGQERFPQFDIPLGEEKVEEDVVDASKVQALGVAITPFRETILDMVRLLLCQSGCVLGGWALRVWLWIGASMACLMLALKPCNAAACKEKSRHVSCAIVFAGDDDDSAGACATAAKEVELRGGTPKVLYLHCRSATGRWTQRTLRRFDCATFDCSDREHSLRQLLAHWSAIDQQHRGCRFQSAS